MKQYDMHDFISFIKEKHGEENWISLYKQITSEDKSENGALFCALVTKEKTPIAMDDFGWDLTIGDGKPCLCTSYENGKSTTNYLSSNNESFKPLVIYREFAGIKEDYAEFNQEFCLFHNLYFDSKNSKYVAFDDAGDEIDVIKFSSDEVKVRKSYLHSFIAATQMDLLLYFELVRYFKEDIHIKIEEDEKSDCLCFSKHSGDSSFTSEYKSFVRVIGKKLIKSKAIDTCRVWPFEKENVYEEFIIGGDLDSPVKFTCNSEMLANYFGKNPDSPHYLTPVFFKKEVMQKYYSSSEYEIQDGYLRRGSLWGLRLDNNQPNYVSVFLGDLGTDLPNKEQIYWKSYNIIPDGHSISDTNFKRSFLAEFSDSTNPEFIFKSKFETLQKAWSEKFGWSIFLPLSEKDEHFYRSLRSLTTNEQSEFDAQILALTKITIDSINEKELRIFIPNDNKDLKSIGLFELLLNKLEINEVESTVKFLRNVQDIRSTGVAHRKGSKYEKAIEKLDIDDENYMKEFDEILNKFSEIFNCVVRGIT